MLIVALRNRTFKSHSFLLGIRHSGRAFCLASPRLQVQCPGLHSRQTTVYDNSYFITGTWDYCCTCIFILEPSATPSNPREPSPERFLEEVWRKPALRQIKALNRVRWWWGDATVTRDLSACQALCELRFDPSSSSRQLPVKHHRHYFLQMWKPRHRELTGLGRAGWPKSIASALHVFSVHIALWSVP